MSDLRKSKSLNLFFNKADLCLMLGCNSQMLRKFFPEHLKKEFGYEKGRLKLNDSQVDEVLKYFRPLLTREERLKIIYPSGF